MAGTVVLAMGAYLIQSGTLHVQGAAGTVRAFPTRSVIAVASVTENVAGSANDERSVMAIAALMPSELSVAVVGTTAPPTCNVTADEVNDEARIGSENVTAIGARRTTLVAPGAGVVDTTFGAVRSTVMVTGAELID